MKLKTKQKDFARTAGEEGRAVFAAEGSII